MKDFQIKPIGMVYDLDWVGHTVKVVDETESVKNGIVLNFLTRLNEIITPTYTDYGSRLYTTVKAPFNNLTQFKIKKEAEQLLTSMKRIKQVDKVEVIEENEGQYYININIVTIYNTRIKGEYSVGD